MNNQQKKNLFASPTLEQYKKINKQTEIEKKFMEFIYSNPNLSTKEYEAKYKSLNQ